MQTHKFFWVVILSLLSFVDVKAQFGVTNTLTPTQYVEDVLIGPGVQVSNIVFSGYNAQIGKFVNGTDAIGFPSGIVMSSGSVMQIDDGGSDFFLGQSMGGGPDGDVLAVAQSVNPFITSTADAAVLTFDFIPSGDTVQFSFVFASDEYTTYSCSEFNDAFGFFVSGPDPNNPDPSDPTGDYVNQNFAVVPNTTTPITISTIHPANAGSCSAPALNGAYYIENTPASAQAFNGYLVPINIRFAVACGGTYSFKFAVADCTDDGFDTGIFLQSGSFSSDAVNISVATVTGDSTIVEGCTQASLIFTRPMSQVGDTLIVNYDMSGTATQGVDFSNLISPITFLPGVDTIITILNPIQDFVNEGPEFITITAYTISECGDTIVTTGSTYILDKPNLNIVENDPNVVCADDSILMTVSTSGGFPPYEYAWSNAQVSDSAYGAVSVNGTLDYYVTSTDNCGFSLTDTVTITLNQTLKIDTMMQYPATACNPDGTVVGLGSGFSGIPDYRWSGPGINSPAYIDASVWQNRSSGWYYFTITDNVCSTTDSIFLEQKDSPVADFTPSVTSGCAPLSVSFTNNSENADSYAGTFGNGETANVGNLNPQSATYIETGTVRLIAYQGVCTDTMEVVITVSACGCTDPLALNYNPLAEINDGTCFYPIPLVETPNIFTPNGDKSNDVFQLKTENAIGVELMIFNRWGNLLFKEKGLDPVWDGKIDGTVVEEGTYFFRYTVFGLDDQSIEGQGFVQIVKD
jgi:gliding motility-associated-like protein